MGTFDEAVAVGARGDGRYDVTLDAEFVIAGKPNGGYLLAVLAAAAAPEAGERHPHPTIVHAHYLTAPDPGPAEVAVEVLRAGRSATQLRATLTAGGRRCVETLLTFGRLAPATDPWWSGVALPEFTPEEECFLAPPRGGPVPVPMLARIEERFDPLTTGFAVGKPTGDAELRAWMRHAEGRAPDPLSLLVAVDCLPPATVNLGDIGAWVPTLELTAHVRALPAPGPLRIRQRARLVTADRLDEECDVWDSAGHLVATGHQLAAMRIPEGPPRRSSADPR